MAKLFGKRLKVPQIEQIDPAASQAQKKWLKRQRVRAIRRGANPKGFKGYF